MKVKNLKLHLKKYLIIVLISFLLTLNLPTISQAQISFSNESGDKSSQFTPLWKLHKTRVCGKFWCSDVNFPYFPYANITSIFNIRNSFTIASRTNLENPQTDANELEIRATVIEQTWLSLYKKIVRNNQTQPEKSNINLQDWFIFNPKPLNFLTPKIEVGIKNSQAVIFAPPQPELGLSQETIITITEDDSIYNGKSIDELANQWRDIIRQDLSEALWGYQFDRLFPWARLAIIGVIFVLTIIPIIFMSILSI